YIVENGWWKLLMEQKTKDGYFSAAPELKEKMLRGKFPAQARERFQELIEYFGQSPIIMRSSSLLEDSFGNAFAGKYESLFLVNQGSPEQRYSEFEEAVRRIYASTMDDSALAYRLERGLAEQDEQMALLVQRVSGSYKKRYFFPDLAGVGVSYNTFVWKPDMDPKAGMLRLVLGLGTRAVERVEDDYPQTIALDEPLSRPYTEREGAKKFSQHKVDILDTQENCLRAIDLTEAIREGLDIKLDFLASEDRYTRQKMAELGMKGQDAWVLTFEKLLANTEFVPIMQRLLKTLDSRYQYPVDVEFTVNFTDDEAFRINLLQCRPLQTKGIRAGTQIPKDIEQGKIFFESQGYIMGGNISHPVKRIIYVDPEKYVELSISQKYSVARLIGKLNARITDRETVPTILLGPGRWGTTTPSLGVPVNFAEINRISVLAEIAYEGGNLMPELSFGTHFFQDLVESDIFYVALFPQKEGVVFNKDQILETPNLLTDILPGENKYKDVIKVCDVGHLQIVSDVVSQKVVCFFAKGA
ncbi:MAG: hypothetical protein JW947_08070, partial [Sedimentisphaerales bacterium]|nr:hypothetical protein [Sedimentisphaerales bacterium]